MTFQCQCSKFANYTMNIYHFSLEGFKRETPTNDKHPYQLQHIGIRFRWSKTKPAWSWSSGNEGSPDSYCGAIRSLIRLTGAKTRLSFHAAKLALAFASMSNFQQDNGAI